MLYAASNHVTLLDQTNLPTAATPSQETEIYKEHEKETMQRSCSNACQKHAEPFWWASNHVKSTPVMLTFRQPLHLERKSRDPLTDEVRKEGDEAKVMKHVKVGRAAPSFPFQKCGKA